MPYWEGGMGALRKDSRRIPPPWHRKVPAGLKTAHLCTCSAALLRPVHTCPLHSQRDQGVGRHLQDIATSSEMSLVALSCIPGAPPTAAAEFGPIFGALWHADTL